SAHGRRRGAHAGSGLLRGSRARPPAEPVLDAAAAGGGDRLRGRGEQFHRDRDRGDDRRAADDADPWDGGRCGAGGRAEPMALGGGGVVVVVGAVSVVALSWLLGQLVPFPVVSATNSQVAQRVSPTLVDLVAALATGAVGAVALARSDISDTLPGVAIAISLV